jgi:hypothetical protein
MIGTLRAKMRETRQRIVMTLALKTLRWTERMREKMEQRPKEKKRNRT